MLRDKFELHLNNSLKQSGWDTDWETNAFDKSSLRLHVLVAGTGVGRSMDGTAYRMAC